MICRQRASAGTTGISLVCLFANEHVQTKDMNTNGFWLILRTSEEQSSLCCALLWYVSHLLSTVSLKMVWVCGSHFSLH